MAETTPYPFQAVDISKVDYKFGGRALCAWDMALGKTFGACHYFRDYLGRAGVMLVVCPDIARGTWAHEAVRHLGMRAEMLHSRRPRVWRLGRPRAGVFVINYDVLHHWADALAALRPNLLVLDECQHLTNPDAARTRAAKHVSRDARHVLALSGTPLANRPIELWPVLNMLRPDKYPSRLEFAEKYCDLKMGKAGTLDVSGASRLPELHAELERDVMVRRRKEDVLADLPPRTRTVVPFTLPRAGAREYAAAAADFRQWLATHAPHLTRRERKAQRLAHLGHLKMTAAAHKLPAVLEWVGNFLDTTNEKLIVFAHHRAVAEAVHRHFGRVAVLVHGGVTGDARRGAVERFNRVPAVRLFVGNLKAAGVAWSCTSADAVAFAEYWWNPATHTQAEDRVRGIGRGTGRPSRAYWLVAEGTIEETLCGILQRKQKIIDSVLDGGDAGTLDVMDELERALAAKPFGRRPCRNGR